MLNEIDRARDALFHIDAGCARDEWVRAGMAAKSAGLSFNDFDNWSASAGNYGGQAECRTVWKSFDDAGGVTPATLYGMAFAQGWQDPNKGCNPFPSLSITAPKQTPPKPFKQATNSNADDVWSRCIPATLADAYIHRKQGKPDGLRVYPATAEPLIIRGQNMAGYLVVPCWSDDKLQTLQFIPPEKGDKLNLAGASFNDGFFTVGEITNRAYIVEGIGQAWAINQATGAAAVLCFGAGRMATVAKVLRDKFHAAALVVVPDKGKEEQAAKIATDVSGQWVAMPNDKPENYDVNDYLLEHGAEGLHKLLSAPNTPQGRFKLLSADEVCNAAPLEWLIKGVIPKQGTAVVFGASGSGKSFFVLAACCAIAGDDFSFYGNKVKHAPVVYVSLEGQAGLGNRLNAWKAHHSKPIPAAMKFMTEPFSLLTDDVPALANSIMRVGGGEGTVIVIDTLNRAATGTNENDSKDMGIIIAATGELQRLTGGLVCLVHHSGKDSSKGMRGHSSLHGALDAAIEVSRDGERRKWIIAKSKDGKDGNEHSFKLETIQIGLDADEDLITSCVALPDDTPVPEKETKPSAKNKLSESAKIGLAALQWAINSKGIETPPEVSADTGTGNLVEVDRVTTMDAWRERFKNTAGEENANAERQAFARAKKWLIENDRISITGAWVYEKHNAVTI